MFIAKKVIVYFGCGLFLLAILVSGCGKKGVEDEIWEDEVMMAHECGLDGLACCPDKDPACQYGLTCCTDPNNISVNMCVEDCACGGLDRFCCKDAPQCDPGGACSGGLCLLCGEKGQPCCADSGCGKNLACHESQCVECGLSGNPCCLDEPLCVNNDAADTNRTECKSGVCAPCGTAGQPACLGNPVCSAEHLLNNNVCYKCGDFNQPCCSDGDFAGSSGCDSKPGLKCNLGFCIK